jgi:DNA replication protein DnaC
MSEPVRVGSVLAAREGFESQPATCGCGETFTQSRQQREGRAPGLWFPPQCLDCTAKDSRAAEAANVAARASRCLAELAPPPLYRDATLDNLEPHGDDANKSRLSRLAILGRRYLTDWPYPAQQVLVFIGGPGTGKGHLAWSVAKGVAALGGSVRVAKLASVIRDLRDAWRRDDGPTEEARLKVWRNLDLLVLDEVSRHAFYGEPMRHLYDLLDYRLEWVRPTIITTNETDAGLSEILGPALMDRLVGAGGLVDFGAVSYRRRPRGA